MQDDFPDKPANPIEEFPYVEWNNAMRISDHGDLPHFNQDWKYQFITTRLGDSLPQTVIRDLETLKESFELVNPKPWDTATQTRYNNCIGEEMEKWLDTGYGECWLRNPKLRTFVSEALWHHNGLSYDMHGYVIMPNHIHMLVLVYEGVDLDRVISSIKKWSAKRINDAVNRKGQLWQRNYHDRFIRNERHLKYCKQYIYKNPRFLPPEEYELWFPDRNI